jgi:hypothetical protein
MKSATSTPKTELIAPCGMDCSACSAYLAFLNGIPRKRGRISHCIGCRPRNKQCAYLKGQCDLLPSNKIEFCFQCGRYPCDRLRRFDQRYRRTYGVSPIQNLEEIRAHGVESFIRSQQKRHGCATCGGMISVHNKKCFVCDNVTSWKD